MTTDVGNVIESDYRIHNLYYAYRESCDKSPVLVYWWTIVWDTGPAMNNEPALSLECAMEYSLRNIFILHSSIFDHNSSYNKAAVDIKDLRAGS